MTPPSPYSRHCAQKATPGAALALFAILLAPLAGSTSPAAQPKKLGVQLLRRHYLFASWSKPRIKDDFTFTGVLVTSLADLSGIATARLDWSAREWVTLQLAAYAPWPGVPSLGTEARGPIEGGLTDYAIVPMDFRLMLGAKFFY